VIGTRPGRKGDRLAPASVLDRADPGPDPRPPGPPVTSAASSRSRISTTISGLEGSAIGATIVSFVRAAASALTKPGVQDGLVAAAVTGTSLVGVMVQLHVDLPEGGGDVTQRSLDAFGIVLVLLQTVPLAWRRRAPVLLLCVTSAAMFLYFELGYLPSFASLGFLVALYTVAAYRDRRTSVLACIGAIVVVLLILAIGREPVDPDAVIGELLIVGGAWSLGDGVRSRRGQVMRLEDRASRLEREREERAAQAVAQERRVIARELHDVVAHHVSVIVAQAGAARRIFGSHPELAPPALDAIDHIGREALVEMRRLMGFLRTEAELAAARSPQPGLRNVDVLLAQVREAGVPVTISIEGDAVPLPAGLDLSAFRIIQEALTNVLKHAGPARADVVIRYEESALVLIVVDDGPGSVRNGSHASPGYGHLGMRERVALFGGQLRVGHRPRAGYEVLATLPLDREPR
jgi:signal transduction histidine kinase